MTDKKALDIVEKAIDAAFEKGRQSAVPSVADCFSFAKYLNENFYYFDNTDTGDVYKNNDEEGLYSEKDIYDEWLNNR